MRRSPRVLPLVPVLAVAVTVAGCSADRDPAVRVGTVARATVTEVVEAPATVTARATATVTAAAAGRVAELRVREGQRVRAGALLLRIQSPAAQRQLRDARRADAQAASAGAVRVPAAGLSRQQREADRAARAAFTRARAQARAIPDRQLRAQTLAAVEAAAAQYAAARAQALEAVRRFDAGLGGLASAVSSLTSAQRVQTRAAVDLAERTVDGLSVTAPISGTVSLSTRTGGEATGAADLLGQLPGAVRDQAGQLLGGAGGPSTGSVEGTLTTGRVVRAGDALLTLTDAGTLSLAAQVDETDVLLVRPGVRASAELDAVPDARYAAAVTAVDPAPTASSRGGVTYVVRLSLGSGRAPDGRPAPEPRPGMSAVVDLVVRTARDAVAVPAPAVFRDGRRDAVWVRSGGVAQRRHVVVGAQGADRVEIVAGLRAGQRVVVRGADRVRAGQRLQ